MKNEDMDVDLSKRNCGQTLFDGFSEKLSRQKNLN